MICPVSNKCTSHKDDGRGTSLPPSIFHHPSSIVFVICVFLSALSFAAGSKRPVPEGLENIWDTKKYISLDEVRAGMNAYCLTEYGTAGVEMFGMEVVDVVRNINIDGSRNIILVKGTDERFIRTGPVAGCSGSPVYINGRMAGALAFTWQNSKEPLYAATPIEDMLRIDQKSKPQKSLIAAGRSTSQIDISIPIDLKQVADGSKNTIVQPADRTSGLTPLPCPVIASGISSALCEQLKTIAEPLGLMVVSGGAEADSADESKEAQMVPGSSLGVPMVSGDIEISVIGTVTDVVGDKVYGFGHPLIGYGQIDLPMATAKVHTVVSSLSTSFKLATVDKTIGVLSLDEASGVIGYIGRQAKTIPLVIRVDNYNDNKQQLYNCRLVNNKLLSPDYLQLALSSAALKAGALAPEHTIEYKATFKIKKYGTITTENISADSGLGDMLSECGAVARLLLDNPFEQADIESFQCDINITPDSISSPIWSVDLSDTTVQAGEEIEVRTILETYHAGKTKYTGRLKVPQDMPPGKYDVIVCGAGEYEKFLVKNVPYRFVAQNMKSLVEALNNALAIPRDRLYCILMLPASGIALETSELPDLPATKALVLQNAKRPLDIKPYQPWVEKSIKTGKVPAGKKTIQITVEPKK